MPQINGSRDSNTAPQKALPLNDQPEQEGLPLELEPQFIGRKTTVRDSSKFSIRTAFQSLKHTLSLSRRAHKKVPSTTPGFLNTLRNSFRKKPKRVSTPAPPSKELQPKKPSSNSSLHFANSEKEKLYILQLLRQHFPERGQVIVIQKPQDLEKHGLLQQTWVEGHQLKTDKGRLFSEQPLCLVLDLTTMTPGQIATINDLLEEAPHSNGNALGKNIHREVITSHEMLTGLKPSGSDCWRRLMRMPEKQLNTTEPQALIPSHAELLAGITLKQPPDDSTVIEIDFSDFDDGFECLFGGITLNERGELHFSEGIFSTLNSNSHLILRNAPWDNPDFTSALATALHNNEFEANNKWLPLPENITLSRNDSNPEQITALKNKHQRAASELQPDTPCLSLNSQQMETLKGGIRLEGAKVVRCNTLEQLVSGCGQLVITSPLSDQQWLRLFTVLEHTPIEHRPALFINEPDLLKPGADVKVRLHGASTDKQQITPSNSDTSISPFIYEVTAQDTWDDLLQQIRLVSQERFLFATDNTPLMECLLQGIPVMLKGLESNPKIAQALETLFASPPCLLLHGKKVDLPKARITLALPEPDQLPQNTPALLLQACKATSSDSKSAPVHPFYKRLGQIPPSATNAYPAVPPWSAPDFQHTIDRQAAHEQKLDNSPSIKPCHYRRALHVLTAKAYREDPKAYGFIKAKIAETWPDAHHAQKANETALKDWLTNHPSPNLKQLKKDFWPLAQHCPISLHQSIEELDEPDQDALQKLAQYVVGAASPNEQGPLAETFKVNKEEALKKQYFNGNTRSTLRDALVASRNHLHHPVSISGEIEKLEGSIARVLASKGSESEKRRQLTEMLSASFRNGLPDSLDTLPQALLDGQRHDHSRHARRLAHLAERAKQHPIIFLQGEAGAGKSFMAQAIGSRLGPADPPHCLVLNLGPNSRAGEQYGEQVMESSMLPDGSTDSYTSFKKGPILEWALSENPPVLVLDEANLAPEGLLAPLAGLTRQPPTLHYQGKVYPLSDKHRVILTGNPDSYDGRHLDNTLSPLIPTFFYPPLPKEVMARAIIQPGLPGSWPDAHKKQASEQILSLFELYQKQLPGELLTPRDIKDVLAVVRQSCSYSSALPTMKQIHACIRRGFSDSLGGALPSEERQSMNQKCMEAFPEDDSILAGPDQAFEGFLEKLQTRYPNTNWGPEPIRELVFSYWQSLEKDDTGRTAVIVEGPAGWGKDFILNQTLSLWLEEHEEAEPFLHINANPNRWDSLVESVRQAMRCGRKIAISELNLIPSRYLEGLFNDVLTGAAAPGFRLFATINPTSFGDREAMSPAMKSRCTQIKLTALSPSDLESFISGQPGQYRELPQWLAQQFHRLSLSLTRQKSPIQLSLDDLMSAAERLSREPDSERRPEVFERCLSIAIRSLKHPDEQANIPAKVDLPGTTTKTAPPCPTAKKTSKAPTSPPPIYSGMTKRSRKKMDGSVTQYRNSHHNTFQFFSSTEFSPRDYRLNLSLLNFSGNAAHVTPVQMSAQEVEIIDGKNLRAWPGSDSTVELQPGEVLGKVQLKLNHHWQPLPALSSEDQLKVIRPGTEDGLETGRCKNTGLLMVRSHQVVKQQPATVDFIIEPNRERLSLQLPDSVEEKSDLLNEKTRRRLEKKIFPPEVDNPSCRELQRIAGLTSPVAQLQALQAWTKSFAIDEDVTGKDMDLLIKLIKNKQGSCRHRSWCFHTLCSYFNIPSRIVSNDCHSYCEVSPDKGASWYRVELGGAPGAMSMQRQEFPPAVVVNKEQPDESSQPAPSKEPEYVEDYFELCETALNNSQNIPESVLTAIKGYLRTLIKEAMSKPVSRQECDFGWHALLKPGFFKYCQSDPEWTQQIKCLLTMAPLNELDYRAIFLKEIDHQVNNIRNRPSSNSDNEAFIGWLCDLCEHSSSYKKCVLGSLQPCLENPEFPHWNRIQALIDGLLPEPPQFRQSFSEFDPEQAKIAAAIPMSDELAAWKNQIAIETEYVITPGENSRLIPARLAAGMPSFLKQTTQATSRPLILDLSDLGEDAERLITTHIKSTPIRNVYLHEKLRKNKNAPAREQYHEPRLVASLFLHWLHNQMRNTSFYTLVDEYTCCSMFKPYPAPFIPQAASYMISNEQLSSTTRQPYTVPKNQIKSVFKQPTAVVIQKKEILQLLSEFLGKIS